MTVITDASVNSHAGILSDMIKGGKAEDIGTLKECHPFTSVNRNPCPIRDGPRVVRARHIYILLMLLIRMLRLPKSPRLHVARREHDFWHLVQVDLLDRRLNHADDAVALEGSLHGADGVQIAILVGPVYAEDACRADPGA